MGSAWLILLALAIGAIVGYSYGLIAAVLALLGLILGAVIGFHITNAISLGSPGWAGLGALLGALAGASMLGRVGHRARARVRIPGLGVVDGILGALLGAGLAIVVLSFTTPIASRLQLNTAAPQAGRGATTILNRIEQTLGIGPSPRPRGPGPAPQPAGR